ncbi:(Na+)-NQR maturation NqrM [Vibrio cholerae]|nr:(Na+)-NQR maturation NqrM [Vibrio cholerae]
MKYRRCFNRIIKKPIQGSCGGLANVEIDQECHCVTTCNTHLRKLHQISEPKNKPLLLIQLEVVYMKTTCSYK